MFFMAQIASALGAPVAGWQAARAAQLHNTWAATQGSQRGELQAEARHVFIPMQPWQLHRDRRAMQAPFVDGALSTRCQNITDLQVCGSKGKGNSC